MLNLFKAMVFLCPPWSIVREQRIEMGLFLSWQKLFPQINFERMSMWRLGSSFYFFIFFWEGERCQNCMSPHRWIEPNYHLILTHLRLNLQILVSRFQIGTFPESYYLKSGKFCTWLSLSPFFLGSHRSCSPILNIIILSVAIPLSHMIHLAFSTSNNLFITRENFEDHIIKFGRLQFVERKCQPLNINLNCRTIRCQTLNMNMNSWI